MLFNPKWSNNDEILSVDKLISWLEKKPENGTYTYYDSSNCLLAQYLKESGYKHVSVGTNYYYAARPGMFSFIPFLSRRRLLPFGLDKIAAFGGTFGGALKLARQLKAARNSISSRETSPQDRLEVSYSLAESTS